MRNVLLALVCVGGLLGFSGCDDDTTVVTPTQDLSVTHADAAAGTTCAGILGCIQKCTAANATTCAPACVAAGSTAAQAKYAPVQACAQPACFVVDGSAGPCANPGSTDCTNCVMNNCGSQLTTCAAN